VQPATSSTEEEENVMEHPFSPLTGQDELEKLIADSGQHPRIVFKHDTSCPISRAAYGQLQQITEQVAVIDVARQKDLSAEIAERTGVQHASPQVLIFHNGQAVWSASQYDITEAAVTQAMEHA
jgi:bacillithiol system protein YtxJ